jgi:hypothetical protein
VYDATWDRNPVAKYSSAAGYAVDRSQEARDLHLYPADHQPGWPINREIGYEDGT